MPKQLTDKEYIRLELDLAGTLARGFRLCSALAYLGMAIHRATHPRKRKE